MTDRRSVVITGASRGLGFASAAHLYRSGWQVLGAMRSPLDGLERLREATGAAVDDSRLMGVQLDLTDPESVFAAARSIESRIGAPDVLVHNAGVAASGCVEETPDAVWQELFATNFFGPVMLTRALLPAMRARGRGRIVVVSSTGGIRGMPSIGAYSASKGALERWAEALAEEVAPFGLSVTVLVAGTFKTDILTEKTPDYGNQNGPYAAHYAGMRRAGGAMVEKANPPAVFARALAKAMEEQGPFVRRAVGFDARVLGLTARLLSGRILHDVVRRSLDLPLFGALRGQAFEDTVTGKPSSKESKQYG